MGILGLMGIRGKWTSGKICTKANGQLGQMGIWNKWALEACGNWDKWTNMGQMGTLGPIDIGEMGTQDK